MDTRRLGCILMGFTLFAVVDGFVLGLFAWMFLQQPTVTSDLQIEPEEYVVLVSAAYASNNNLAEARQRLSMLDPDPAHTTKFLSDAVQHAQARNDVRTVNTLSQLRQAFGSSSPVANNRSVETATATSTLVVTAFATPETTALAAEALTPTATATPTVVATATPTRTPLNTPTATRTRTPTPRATPTRRPPRATPTAVIVVVSAPTATATPNVDFRITLVRQLTPCENGGGHHLFILVLDQQGNGIPNTQVEVVWPSGSFRDFTGKKSEVIPALGVNAKTTAGYLNYPMYRGSYRARIADAVSEQTGWLNVDIPRDELCAITDDPIGNSLYHYSYLIVFQKVR